MTNNGKIRFERGINKNSKSSNENINKNNQIILDKAKKKIVEEYHVSDEEAERIVSILIRKRAEKQTEDNESSSKSIENNEPVDKNIPSTLENTNSEVIKTSAPQQVIDKEKSSGVTNNIASGALNDYELSEKIQNPSVESEPFDVPIEPSFKQDNNSKEYGHGNNFDVEKSDNMQNRGDDVDSIISDLIPDYKQNVAIELNNVNLTFEIEKDKVDTIKEEIIRTLNKTKPHKFKINALKNINLKFYKGEKIGIIGYNGAGKSTLLNVISGIFPPDTGVVKTYGTISPLLSLGAGFNYNYSGRKNIKFNGAALGYDKKFLESKIDEIIEFAELGEYIDIPIKNYSSGMLAKLGFSIATIVEPDILIIDEILGVGDVSFRKKSNDKIKSLMASGTTVLLVSHSIQEIRDICDKAVWIDQGTVREFDEVNIVCDHYLKDAEKASNEQIRNIQLK